MNKKLAILATTVMLMGLTGCKKKPIVAPESSVSEKTSEIITSETTSEEHIHNWTDWSVIKPATHTTEGEEVRMCTTCKEQETRPTDKKAEHEWSAWKVTKEATHTEEGSKERTCVCGEKETEKIEKTTAHEYGEWVTTKEATHVEEGSKERTCSCGDKDIQPIAKTTAHEWGDWTTTKEATHTAEGSKERTCPCGEKDTQPIAKTTDHEYGEWTVATPSTCSKEGEQRRTCACGSYESKPIEKIAHTPGEWKAGDNDQHYTVCTVCGESYGFESHTFAFKSTVSPTCYEGGYDIYECSVCGKQETRNEKEKYGHTISVTEPYQYTSTEHWDNCIRCNDTERLAHDFTADHPMWCKTCGYYGGDVTEVHGSILIDLSMTKDLKLTFNDSHSYKITVVSGTVSKPLEFYTADRTKNEVSIGELHGFYKDTEYIFSAGENKSGVIKIELAGHTLDWDGKCLYCKQDVSVAATLGKKYTLDIDANMADVYKYSLTGPTRPVLVMDDYSQLDDYSALRTDNQNFLWENNMNWSGFSITTSGSVTGYLKLKAKAAGTGIHTTMYLAQNVFKSTKSTKVEDGRLVINGISAVSFNGSKQIGIIYRDLTIRYFTVYNFEDMDNPGSGSCDAGGDLMVYLTPVDGGSVTTTGLSSANYFYKS